MASELIPPPVDSPSPPRAGQKTYWHLLERRRVPSDYELVTTHLHYYPEFGFAVATPVADWYRRHQGAAPVADALCTFADPRETTYASYVRRKHEQEIHLQRMCATHENVPSGAPLRPAALALWEAVIAPARFPLHGLQMLAAYSGSMAPWSRLTVALALQAADEVQRIHRIAYRLRQLQGFHPRLAVDSRDRWENAPMWQGIRETVERMLVVFEWPDCYLALNVALKPLWEALVFGHCAGMARELGDPVLATLLDCYSDDGAWHAECARTAIAALLPDPTERAAVLERVSARWNPLVRAAFSQFADALDAITGGPISARARLERALGTSDGPSATASTETEVSSKT